MTLHFFLTYTLPGSHLICPFLNLKQPLVLEMHKNEQVETKVTLEMVIKSNYTWKPKAILQQFPKLKHFSKKSQIYLLWEQIEIGNRIRASSVCNHAPPPPPHTSHIWKTQVMEATSHKLKASFEHDPMLQLLVQLVFQTINNLSVLLSLKLMWSGPKVITLTGDFFIYGIFEIWSHSEADSINQRLKLTCFCSNPSEDGVLQALTVEPPSGVKNVSMQFIIKKKEFFDYETRQTFSFDVNQFCCCFHLFLKQVQTTCYQTKQYSQRLAMASFAI